MEFSHHNCIGSRPSAALLQTFSFNVLRLMAEMLEHGYSYRTLKARLYGSNIAID